MGSSSKSSSSSTSTTVNKTSTLDLKDVQKATILSNVDAGGNVTLTDNGAVGQAFEFASETQAGAAGLVEQAIYSGQAQVDKLAQGFKSVLEQKQSQGATVWANTIKTVAWVGAGFGIAALIVRGVRGKA